MRPVRLILLVLATTLVSNSSLGGEAKNDKIDDILDFLVNMRNSVDTLTDKVSGIEETVHTISVMEDKTAEHVSKLEDRVEEVKSEVSDVKSEVSDVKSEVSNVKSKISDVTQKVSDVKAEVSDVKGVVSDTEKQLGEVKSEVSEVTKKVGDVTQEVGNVKKQVEKVDYDVIRNTGLLGYKYIGKVHREFRYIRYISGS